MKVWWSEEKVDPMPALSEPIPEGGSWKSFEMSLSDFSMGFYPICSRDFCITKKLSMGTDMAVMQTCPAEGGFSAYKKWLDDGQSQRGLDESKWGETRVVRSFRLELADPKWGEKDTPLAFDANIFRGSKVQGQFTESHIRQFF